MKALFLLPFAVLASASLAKAIVTINLGAGQLLQSDGTTPVLNGTLIQLVADTQNNGFSAPTVGSFTGGSSDDVVLVSFGGQSGTTGIAGAFFQELTIDTSLFANLNGGDRLMLRWFPTLTTSSSPGTISGYGEFRTDGMPDNSEITWVMPGVDGTYALNFQTSAMFGGSQPTFAGIANLTAVPEPSTYGLMGAGALAAAFVRRRRRRG